MDLILVSLQADKPPAGKTHGKTCQDATKNGTNYSSFPAASGDGHTQTTTSTHNYECCQNEVTAPGDVSQMATVDWKETKDLDRKKRQTEDMGRGG